MLNLEEKRAKQREYSRRYIEKNRDKIKAKGTPRNSYRRSLLRNYGLTPDQYANMEISQVYACAICEKRSDDSNLCVDHNHKTGQVRGLLCHRCNRVLGYLENGWYEKARKYLDTHTNNQVDSEL